MSTALPRLEVVDTAERLLAIEAAWTELWLSTDRAVFQSHAWIATWWTTIPDSERRGLRVVLAWRGAALEAVLPLAICRRRGLRLLEWAAKDYTDYGDVLIAPRLDPVVVQQMWEHAWAAGGFDLAYLNRLLPKAAARVLLPQATTPSTREASKLRSYHRRETSFRLVGTWASGSAWFEDQSKKFRQNYRRGMKAMSEFGTIGFRLVGPDEPLDPIFERFCVLKRRSLTGNAIETRRFDAGSTTLCSLMRVLAGLGILRIFVLECDGLIVAVAINFVQSDTMMAFLTTYDPTFARGSPGAILMIDYIRWSVDRGLGMIDFLCGGEDFKRRFSTDSVCLDSAIAGKTLAGKTALMAERCSRAARSIRRRLRTTSSRSRRHIERGLKTLSPASPR